MYHVELMDYKNEFMAIKEHWNQIVLSQPDFVPFLLHEWMYYSYEAGFFAAHPFVLTIKRQREIVGFVPFCAFPIKIRNTQLNAVAFPENPDVFVNNIICSENLDTVLPYIFAFFKKNLKWDIILLEKIHKDSMLFKLYPHYLSQFFKKSYVRNVNTNLYINMQKSWDEYYSSLSKNFRKSNRGVKNRLERFGKIDIETYSTEDGNMEKAFEEMVSISLNSWKKDKGVALARQKASMQFIKNLTKFGLPGSSVIIYLFRINDVAAAAEYHVRSNGFEYALRADYRRDLSQHSPGTFLDYHIIKNLFDNNISCYELGPGLNPYKLKWTDSGYETMDILISNNSMKPSIVYMIEKSRKSAGKFKDNIMQRFGSRKVN